VKQRSIWRLAGAVLLALAGSAIGGVSPSLAQAPSHVFDPVLSVTGGCTVSTRDPIPDPPRQEGTQEQEIAECEAGDHPSENLFRVTGLDTDSYGNLYVANQGPNVGGVQSNPHVNVFDPESNFITEISTPVEPEAVAVDSDGYLYVYTNTEGENLLRYDPAPTYDAAAGIIVYETTPTIIDPAGWPFWPFIASLAVNPENDHLFVNFGNYLEGLGGARIRSAIVEFGSGAEGNPLLDDEVAEVEGFASKLGLTIDASRGRIYATDQEPDNFPDTGARLIRVFELAAPHNLIATFDGSSLPEGTFVKCGTEPENCPRQITIAADESTGNLFVYDIEKNRVIYELDENGQYLATIDYGLLPNERTQITVDNGQNSPHGQLNPEGRYLWVVENPHGVGHADAFKPTKVGPPLVEVSFSNVNGEEALLEAEINPNQAATTYSFEFVSKAQFEVSKFDGAQVVGQGTIEAGTLPVSVSAQVRGLTPGSSYVFRVLAQNEASPPLGEAEAEFRTFPAVHFASCPNDATRTGPSAALPDCRAYELVTPPNTGGRPPMGLGLSGALTFPALPASPAGERLSFRIENGLIPGLDGTASLPGDPYLSTRGSDGWETVATGASGTQAEAGAPGGRSPDQTYSVWAAEGQGSAVIGGERTIYVRYPDGHSELLGQGSLRTDPQPEPKLIAEGGAHMIFASALRLEEEAPLTGLAIYDRTPDGITHVVSLLPSDQTPSGSQQVTYRGSSLDGRGVAFDVAESGTATLYLRRDNQITYPIGAGLTFEGVAEGGARILYLQAGNLKAFDATTGKTISFAGGGQVTVVNVSADGSTAYLVSPDKLTSNPNPLGDRAIAGDENLYRSREGAISFVSTVSTRDVEGEGFNLLHDGLGLWVSAVHGVGSPAVAPGSFASDPSRSTADGSTLLFQSDSDLTDYEAEGSRQIYRYDATANQLACLSCTPTGTPPTGDALLQNVSESAARPEPNTSYDLVLSLAADGRRAFFQSPDQLVAADTDGLQDVYEWEAQGVGSCSEPAGCVYLISSGRSEKINYLYAASASGDDVFFRTSDLLVPADKEPIPSIYDARVGGGFVEEPAARECEGEGCRPQLTEAPALPGPASSPPGPGNVRKTCPKGKRRIKRAGKVRCVKKRRHHHRRHHRHAGQSKKGGRK
jgi:hypothetical protein